MSVKLGKDVFAEESYLFDRHVRELVCNLS